MVEAESENAGGEIRDVGGVWHWGFVGNVEKVKVQPRKVTSTNNPFQTFTTIDESEDQPLEPPSGLAAKGPIEVYGFEVRRKADDKSWPKLKEPKPSTSNHQP